MITPALYYPYIHFRDTNWLKASLLYFQQIRRIVPPGYPLNDDPREVQELHNLKGFAKQKLIEEEPALAPAVWEAQRRLKARLAEQPKEFLRQFTRAKAEGKYGGGKKVFEMHVGKMYPLVDFLHENKVAWPSENPGRLDPKDWVWLHPKLGEAIMSIIAIAIAKGKGLGIVTSSGEVHRALAEQDEDLVLYIAS